MRPDNQGMAATPPDERCTRCRCPLVLISFTQGPSLMTMGSCASCHTRSWWRDDVSVGLGDVLADLVAALPPSSTDR